jgi:divalent metal cation (Fe/Co/Zn/Cd) transporter
LWTWNYPREALEQRDIVGPMAVARVSVRTESPVDWSRRARWLSIATIAWNVVEGIVAMAFGFHEESVALFGFGVDSWVEVGSAGVVYWKLTRTPGCASTQKARERRATRSISGLFLALACATAFGAVAQLVAHRHPDSTVPALIVSSVSLSIMVFLWRAKRATAEALDSRALAMDASCSRACIQLSAVLFAGSVVFLVAPSLWWADAVAALGLAVLIAREGLEGWKATGRPDFEGGCGCG